MSNVGTGGSDGISYVGSSVNVGTLSVIAGTEGISITGTAVNVGISNDGTTGRLGRSIT